MSKLTAKQRRFVEEYLVDLNATRAAIRAGYSNRTAYSIGDENLKKPEIKEAITKALAERSKRTTVDQDRVVTELAKIAFSNITDFLKIKDNEVVIFDTDSIPPESLAALSTIKTTSEGIIISVYDKVKALEMLGKHLGMFKDKVELSGTVNNPFEGLTTEQLIQLIEMDEER